MKFLKQNEDIIRMQNNLVKEVGGYSDDFKQVLLRYIQHKEKYSTPFRMYPGGMSPEAKDKLRNLVRNHEIAIDENENILIVKTSYYQQNQQSAKLERIKRKRYIELRSKYSQTIYKRNHFVKLLQKRDEKKVFEECHIVDGIHKGIYLCCNKINL